MKSLSIGLVAVATLLVAMAAICGAAADAAAGAKTTTTHPVRARLNAFVNGRDFVISPGDSSADAMREQRPMQGRCRASHHADLAAGFGASQECQNGEYCGGNETCCGGGSYCCDAGTACCGGTCCNNGTDYKAETCCPDPKNGGVCCLKENTFCCPPDTAFDKPSRCCPRWYVCCLQGRFGCCDPDSGLPMEEHQRMLHAKQNAAKNAPALFVGQRKSFWRAASSSASSSSPQARAIFEENSIWTDESYLYANNLDLLNGSMSAKQKLTPGVYHTEQETTRVFAYSPKRDMFYLIQANFTDPALGYPITLYRFTPSTGAVTKQLVTGAAGEVSGYYWSREQEVLLFATLVRNKTDPSAVEGYKFYTLDVDSAAATFVSTFTNTNGVDSFAGWFHEASADLKYVYRLGFKDMMDSTNYGLGVVSIGTPTATLEQWITVSPPAGGYGRLRSIHRVPGASSDSGGLNISFVSLSQAQNLTDYLDLGVFLWSPSAVGPIAMHQLTQFGNAHLTELFGPIAQATDVTRTKYAALVVQYSDLGSTYNSWALAEVNLLTGASNLLPLSPSFLSSINSLSGFGIPDSS